MDERKPQDFEVIRALAHAQAEFPTIAKTREAQAGPRRYKYADLADILQAVRPALQKHALAITQTVKDECLVSYLHHAGTGSTLVSSVPLTAAQGQGPQALGSALTYARRYGLSLLLGIVAEDDDDGQAAEAARDNSAVDKAYERAKNAKNGTAPVTEKQLARLFAIAHNHGFSTEQVHEEIKLRYEKDSAKLLVRSEYDALVEAIEKLGKPGAAPPVAPQNKVEVRGDAKPYVIDFGESKGKTFADLGPVGVRELLAAVAKYYTNKEIPSNIKNFQMRAAKWLNDQMKKETP